jgi:hypothetical protein
MADEPELFGAGEGADGPFQDTPSPFSGPSTDALRAKLGRPRGARNRKTEAFEKWFFAKGYVDPAQRLAELLSEDPRVLVEWLDEHAGFDAEGNRRRGPSILEVVRMQIAAAGELMPYLHGKKPTDINITDERLPTLIIMAGDNQLDQARQLLEARQAALSVGAALIEGGASEINGLEDEE